MSMEVMLVLLLHIPNWPWHVQHEAGCTPLGRLPILIIPKQCDPALGTLPGLPLLMIVISCWMLQGCSAPSPS